MNEYWFRVFGQNNKGQSVFVDLLSGRRMEYKEFGPFKAENVQSAINQFALGCCIEDNYPDCVYLRFDVALPDKEFMEKSAKAQVKYGITHTEYRANESKYPV